ncbi:hypothetical protein WJX84_009024 [Apatococcus fuscideae]|uniref:Transcription initiation factor TFIID subunit 12 domain-containing protein n=1 Tax=Apatococcus fuscideae TaxID=2026836 RepID=A0AAW1SNX4_9CHLO
MQNPNSQGDTASSAANNAQLQKQQLVQKIWPRLPEQTRLAYQNRPQGEKEAVCLAWWQKLRVHQQQQLQQRATAQQNPAGQSQASPPGQSPQSTQHSTIQRAPSPLGPMPGIQAQGGHAQAPHGQAQHGPPHGMQHGQAHHGMQHGAPHGAQHGLTPGAQHGQNQHGAPHAQIQQTAQQRVQHGTQSGAYPPHAAQNAGGQGLAKPAHSQPQPSALAQLQQQSMQQQQGIPAPTHSPRPHPGYAHSNFGTPTTQQYQQQQQQQQQGGMTQREAQAHADAYFQPTPQPVPAPGNPSGWPQQTLHQQQQQMNWQAAQQMAGLHQPASSQALASRPNTPGQGVLRPASGMGGATAAMQPAMSSALLTSAPQGVFIQAGLPMSQQLTYQGHTYPSASAGPSFSASGQPVYLPTTGQAPMRAQQPITGNQGTSVHQLMQQHVIQQQRASATAVGRPASGTPTPAAAGPRRATRGRGREGGGSKPPRKKGRVEGPAAPGNGAADGLAGADSLDMSLDRTSGAMTPESLEKLLARAVAPGNSLTGAAEGAVLQLVDDFLGGAVAFGCGLARRRKGGRLEAADIAAYLERTWCIQVPGFSGGAVPVARPHPPAPLHETRLAAVQDAAAQAIVTLPAPYDPGTVKP